MSQWCWEPLKVSYWVLPTEGWDPDYSQGKETGQGGTQRGGGGCESVVNDPSIPRYNVPTTVVSRSSPHRDSRAAQARLGDQAGEGFKKGKEKSFPES